jgi:hypothetical protein
MADDPMKLQIAQFSGTLAQRGGVGAGDFVSVLQVRELQKRLAAIEPRLRTQFVRDIKKVGKPLESQIKAGIGTIEPLSGMRKDQGRLGWGVGVAPDKTLIQFRTSMGGKSLTTSLLRIKVQSPGTVLVDMAGRSGRYVGQGRRNDNATPSEKRRNANPAKGAAFIRSLNEKNGKSASRRIWPSAEQSLPAIRREVEEVLSNAFRFVNMKGL